MTTWTNARLQKLFERYRRLYWPRSRRLGRFRIEMGSLVDQGAVGMCSSHPCLITIDVASHPSDREVRATVLHEMIHAVVGTAVGHGAPFWAQLEYLLARSAPVTVRMPELGERGTLLGVIPRRFRRCRRLFRAAYAKDQRRQRHQAALGDLKDDTITPDTIAQEAGDAAMDGVPWRMFWLRYGRDLGFIDLDNRTRPFAHGFRAAARRGWRRGRAEFLRSRRLSAVRPAVIGGTDTAGQSTPTRPRLSPHID